MTAQENKTILLQFLEELGKVAMRPPSTRSARKTSCSTPQGTLAGLAGWKVRGNLRRQSWNIRTAATVIL